jgi:hypothetical protein
MTDTQAIKGLLRAVSRRQHAEELWTAAMHDVREWCRAARDEGVAVARIAHETGLSERAVRDLLAGKHRR